MSSQRPVSPLSDRAAADIVAALGVLPETFWDAQDDLCDCTYQRIGMWTNPYLAETLEVRMCCIWKELYKLFPEHVRVTPAFLDGNADEWVTEPAEWNGEADMPRSIWYRQLARRQGRSVTDIRNEYRDRDAERPRGIPRPPQPPGIDPVEALFAMLSHLAERVVALEAK